MKKKSENKNMVGSLNLNHSYLKSKTNMKKIFQTCIWDELRVSNEKNKSIKLLNESIRNYP